MPHWPDLYPEDGDDAFTVVGEATYNPEDDTLDPITFYISGAELTGEEVAGIPIATHPDVPEGHAYLTYGTSTPNSAAGGSPFAEWLAEQEQ